MGYFAFAILGFLAAAPAFAEPLEAICKKLEENAAQNLPASPGNCWKLGLLEGRLTYRLKTTENYFRTQAKAKDGVLAACYAYARRADSFSQQREKVQSECREAGQSKARAAGAAAKSAAGQRAQQKSIADMHRDLGDMRKTCAEAVEPLLKKNPEKEQDNYPKLYDDLEKTTHRYFDRSTKELDVIGTFDEARIGAGACGAAAAAYERFYKASNEALQKLGEKVRSDAFAAKREAEEFRALSTQNYAESAAAESRGKKLGR